MNLTVKTLKRYISYILFICGEIANTFGLYIAIRMQNGVGSIISTALCFLSMALIFIFSCKKDKPEIFLRTIVIVVGMFYFPTIWINTKSPNTFILNTFLVPVSYSISVNKKRDFIIPAINLLIYNLCILIKMNYIYCIIYTVIYSYILVVPSLFSMLLTKYSEQLNKEKMTLENMAERDELTGLFNRYMLQRFMNEEEKWIPIMLDIDHFKNVNDTYGHDEGDRVLKRLAEILLRFAKDSFRVFRYGGEEFLIISKLSEDSTDKRVIEFVEAVRRELRTSNDVPVTVSVGIGQKAVLDSTSVKIADVNLYLCKNEGRNCICKENKLLYR